MKYYAQRKVYRHRHKGNFEQYATLQLQRNRKEVVDLLKHIMEKKVFNLQCRWVAGEMDIEGIEHSAQFVNWDSNVVLQNAVGPIRLDEFYCYLDWYDRGSPERLDEHGYPEASGHIALTHYHSFRSDFHHDFLAQLPEWFHEYDRHFGTASLHLLPTVRRDIEQDHLDEWSRVSSV